MVAGRRRGGDESGFAVGESPNAAKLAAGPLEQARGKLKVAPPVPISEGATGEQRLVRRPSRCTFRSGRFRCRRRCQLEGVRRGGFEVAAGPVGVGALDRQRAALTSMVPPFMAVKMTAWPCRCRSS